jgi:hypothetical protein
MSTEAFDRIGRGLFELNRYYKCNQGSHDMVIYSSGLSLCDLSALYPGQITPIALGLLEDSFTKKTGRSVRLFLNRYGAIMLMRE